MRSLAIISHTEHYVINNQVVGWEPTVREINYLAGKIDEIYHIAPLHSGYTKKPNMPYASNITFVALKPSGGNSFIKKINIIYHLPYNLFKIMKIIKKVKWIHVRLPMNLGIFLIPLLYLYKKKYKWVKYAGNWKQINIPLTYSIQRWLLNKNIQKSFVTINGEWKGQKQHLLSFNNPCMTNKELIYANEIAKEKSFFEKLTFCFVGRFDNNKGINRVVSVLELIERKEWVADIYIVGEGTEKIQKLDSEKIKWCGWLPRKKINAIYEKAHIIILPTLSEGFPKVLSEAASYGCVPIVSDIAPINQFIVNNTNGLLLDKPYIVSLEKIVRDLDEKRRVLNDLSASVVKLSKYFTYNYYYDQLNSKILNRIEKGN